MNECPVLHVSVRDVPVPTTVSQEAQAVLASWLPTDQLALPTVDDTRAWKSLIHEPTKEISLPWLVRGQITFRSR
jgi:epsilon-lactone hydrolase